MREKRQSKRGTQQIEEATPPKSFASYFATLFPMVDSPLQLGDFKPISLLGSLYKLIVKVLMVHLSLAMDKLISGNHPSGFLKGRQLVDEAMAVNEIINLARRTRNECLIFKVDFEETYDSVS